MQTPLEQNKVPKELEKCNNSVHSHFQTKSVLHFSFLPETAANYLKSLQTSQAKVGELEEKLKNNPPNSLLTDQLKVKQREIEELRKNLEQTNQELNSLKKEQSTLLDDNLSLKHQNLKDWFKEYEKNVKLSKELKENVDYASDELLEQDKTISSLRKENNQLKLEKQSLQKDLNLATKLAELRKNPLPENNSNHSNLLVYAFLAFWFMALLNNSWKYKDN